MGDSAKTQSEKILTHMLRGNRISPIVALEEFGCMRLGARIHEIKAMGFEVQDEFVEAPGPGHTRFKEYWIEAEDRRAA